MTPHPLARPLVWALPLVVLLPALAMPDTNDGSGKTAVADPAAPYSIKAVDGADVATGEPGWNAARPIDWQRYAQGEYVGHGRLSHVDEYRLRPGDVLDCVLRVTRRETSHPYRVNPGDLLRIESFTDDDLNEELVVQADGTITPRLLGSVHVARRAVQQIRDDLERRYQDYYKVPAITVTPIRVNARLEDLRATADDRMGRGGQARQVTVTPEGTVQLAALGSVSTQGLSLDELKRELDERLAERVEGIEITPVLVTRAARYVYVAGEVVKPGRYLLTGPTTAMQAISLAGGWNYGGNLWNAVVFRRGDDWRLLATQLDLRGALYGHRPAPADEIWLNDSDIVLVPKTGLLTANNATSLTFTKGLFGVAHYRAATTFNFARLSGLLPSIGVPVGVPIVPVIPLPHP
ncbi:MAG TPA: polysaccharide biosynthesis/export family protein [Pirellulales bacterium]|nr:polysaccharide biosynthesis/export family protein [Pirellulales bacterium]